MISDTQSPKVQWSDNPKQALISIEEISSCICTFYNNGKANVMVVDNVFTEKKHQGKGHGIKLMGEALKLAKKMKVDSVELVVNKDNVAAKKLYEKMGFYKTEKDYYRIILNKWAT